MVLELYFNSEAASAVIKEVWEDIVIPDDKKEIPAPSSHWTWQISCLPERRQEAEAALRTAVAVELKSRIEAAKEALACL